MTNSKNTKRALLASVLSLMLCAAMLVGSTFAWFTDSVQSGNNKIVAGNLDVELYHTNGNVTTEEKVNEETQLFVNTDGSPILWEPGVMVYENFTVKNVGKLALKYKLNVNVADFNTVDGTKSLKDVLKVAILDGHFTGGRTEALALNYDSTVAGFEKVGTIDAGAADNEYAIVIYWEPTANDNDYNLNNGKTSSDGEALFIDLGVNLIATQNTVEKDSFDEQYDKNAWLEMTAVANEDGTYENDGKLYVKDDSGFVAVTEDATTEGLYTAENGDKYVTTVEAFDAVAPQGGNVTVMTDIEKTYTTTDSTNFLDIPATEAPANIDFSNKTVTIESASGKNGIKGTPGTVATISNGTIKMDKAWGTSCPAVNADKCTITLNNMNISVEATEPCVSSGSDGGKLIINNSTIKSASATTSAVFAGSGTTVEISGDDTKIVGRISVMVNATVIIRGGDYTEANIYNGKVTAYAGTFAASQKSKITVAKGSKMVDNGDGTLTVTAG